MFHLQSHSRVHQQTSCETFPTLDHHNLPPFETFRGNVYPGPSLDLFACSLDLRCFPCSTKGNCKCKSIKGLVRKIKKICLFDLKGFSWCSQGPKLGLIPNRSLFLNKNLKNLRLGFPFNQHTHKLHCDILFQFNGNSMCNS